MMLRVKYFQSWKEVNLDFAPFTIIVGPSNSGKTAIVRALEAVLFNTKGNDFITRGAKQCEVELELPNGDIINYVKGSSVKYKIKDKEYSAIGRGPFKEVESLGFQELTSELVKIRPQISRQHDAPFLISSAYTPTVVGSILNSLSEAAQAQSAKRMVEKDTKALTSRIKYKEEDLRDTEGKVAKKQDWTNITEIYDNLTQSNDKIATKHVVAAQVDETLEEFKRIKEEIADITQKQAVYDQILGDVDVEYQTELLLAKDCTNEDAERAITTLKLLKKLIDLIKDIVTFISKPLKDAKIFLSEMEEKMKVVKMIKDLQIIKGEIDCAERHRKEVYGLQLTINHKLKEFEKCNECGRYL